MRAICCQENILFSLKIGNTYLKSRQSIRIYQMTQKRLCFRLACFVFVAVEKSCPHASIVLECEMQCKSKQSKSERAQR